VSAKASLWNTAPQCVALGLEDVHVWRASLELPDSRIAELERVLDVDEKQRARRFHFKKDQDRFIAARGLLRILLGRYLQCAPSEPRFALGRNGKPELASPPVKSLQFNVSHSGSLALYAFSIEMPVGVDVEQVRPDVDAESIARKHFSSGEVQALLDLPAEQRIDAFFRCWTRKEAFIKARGDGILFGLKNFTVSVMPDAPALLDVQGDDVSRWSMSDVSPGAEYKAAIVVERKNWNLHCWEIA
jgi:4'-phosphopantetheinyl transferase